MILTFLKSQSSQPMLHVSYMISIHFNRSTCSNTNFIISSISGLWNLQDGSKFLNESRGIASYLFNASRSLGSVLAVKRQECEIMRYLNGTRCLQFWRTEIWHRREESLRHHLVCFWYGALERDSLESPHFQWVVTIHCIKFLFPPITENMLEARVLGEESD